MLAGEHDPGADRYLTPDEARVLLEDPLTGDRESEEGIQRAWVHELHLTPSGRRLFEETHRRFGQELDRIDRAAREEIERVDREHPEFSSEREQYFRDVDTWVETGEGPMPEPPEWPE